MDIYYLYNSGFAVETGGDALIFDYYRGSLNRPWRMPLDKSPGGYRGVYVFASHAHGDHYSREIFKWLSERGDIRYILSDDIKPAVPSSASMAKDGSPAFAYMREGDRVNVGSLCVTAYGSTDAGVSFHVATEDGTSIFHAGDFNYWHWRDESTDAEVAEADAMFTDILNKIRAGVGKIDVAFFPVDPRMGDDYYRGAIRFCEATRPALLVPMHFASVFAPPAGFYAEIGKYTKVAAVGPAAGKLTII